MTRAILQPDAWDELQRKREMDFSFPFTRDGAGAMQCAFSAGSPGAGVAAGVAGDLPDPQQLGIPQHVIQMGETPHGLILVSGPTGSGKSTTLAAIVEHINNQNGRRM